MEFHFNIEKTIGKVVGDGIVFLDGAASKDYSQKDFENICLLLDQVEHSRHRSLHNFLVNMMSAISAYCLFPKKPSIRLEPVSDTESCRQLCLF